MNGYRDNASEEYMNITGWFENGLLVYEPFLQLLTIIPAIYEYSGRKGRGANQLFLELKQIVPWVPPGRAAYYLALHSCGFGRSERASRYGEITIQAKLINLAEDSNQRRDLFKLIGDVLTQKYLSVS